MSDEVNKLYIFVYAEPVYEDSCYYISVVDTNEDDARSKANQGFYKDEWAIDDPENELILQEVIENKYLKCLPIGYIASTFDPF